MKHNKQCINDILLVCTKAFRKYEQIPLYVLIDCPSFIFYSHEEQYYNIKILCKTKHLNINNDIITKGLNHKSF